MNLTDNFDSYFKKEFGGTNANSSVSEQKEDISKYIKASRVRNVCFVQPDGKSLFLNYAYLISGEFFPEETIIKLIFSSHQIILKGYNLNNLYEEFLMHLPRKIIVSDERYIAEQEKSDPVVISAEIIET